MNLRQKFGGANQSISVLSSDGSGVAIFKSKSNIIHTVIIMLLVLLFPCMNGIGLAQMSQNSLDIGNSNPSSGSSPIFWLEAQPNDIPIPRDKLIAYKPVDAPNLDTPQPLNKTPKGDVVISLFSGKGFALKGNETHVLRMNVELIKDIDPMYLRSLISSNKSIEDIKEWLNSKEGNTSLRGSVRLNESSYSMLNIMLVSYKNNSTMVDADLAKLYLKPDSSGIMRPYASDRIAVVGNIEITVATSEGGLVGKGELILDSDDLSGKYIVLLHVKKPLPYDMPPHKGV